MGGEIYPPLPEYICQSYEIGEYSQDPLTSIEVTDLPHQFQPSI